MAYSITIAAQSILFNSVKILATVIDGIGPFEYKWYRSTTSGFVPGPGNLIAGQTDEMLQDSGLIPNTIYYYVGRVTDTGNSNVEVTSTELTVTTASQSQSMNQFSQAPTRGQPDQQFNTNTISCIIDPAFTGVAYPGTAVKLVPTTPGSGHASPLVTPCTAETDEVFGFITFDIKNPWFGASMAANISIKNNVLYLYATEAINGGAQVQLDLLNNGIKVGDDVGDTIVGWAFDPGTPGQLFRVYLETPSFRKAT